MIFSWEFSKLLESIIFRGIFICVEKFNYIKNYMKTRCETRTGGQPCPHFVLKTEHLNYTRRRRSAKYERFIKTFLKRDQGRRNWRFFCEKKNLLYFLLSGFFFYLLCVYRGIPFSAMLPSFLVCWKNLDQFLLRQSFVNHPTMTVKMWKFLF